MTSTELAREVSVLEQQVNALASQLDALVVASRGAIAAQATGWIQRELSRTVDEKPAEIQSLGLDRLRTFKQSVAGLGADMESFIERETSDPKRRPHRTTVVAKDGRGEDEPYFQALFRGATSRLGPLLDEYGLLGPPRGWVASWQRTPGGGVRYAINPGFDHRPPGTVEQYHKLHAQYREAEKRLTATRTALEKVKARVLWEPA